MGVKNHRKSSQKAKARKSKYPLYDEDDNETITFNRPPLERVAAAIVAAVIATVKGIVKPQWLRNDWAENKDLEPKSVIKFVKFRRVLQCDLYYLRQGDLSDQAFNCKVQKEVIKRCEHFCQYLSHLRSDLDKYWVRVKRAMKRDAEGNWNYMFKNCKKKFNNI